MAFSKSLIFLSMAVVTTTIFADVNSNENELGSSSDTLQKNEPVLMVKNVMFSGNNIFTDQQLKELLEKDLGQTMTLDQIKQLAKQIQNAYHEEGYTLTRVVIPEQDFKDNQPVQILVLEGKLGNIEYNGNKHYNPKFITQYLSASDIVSGRAFTLGQLENTLTRINRQSGVKVVSVLKPGAEQGTTDISIQVNENPRVIAALELNNYGSKNTGEYRAQPYLDVFNLTGRGDNLSLMGMHSIDGEGSYFARLAYNTPINSLGTKAAIYAYTGNVRVGEQLAVLDIKGDNTGYGFGLQHDFVKDPFNFFQIESWFESYDLKQTILDEEYANDKIRKIKLVGNYEHLNENSRSIYSLSLHQGLGEVFGAMPDNSIMSTRSISGADNNFTKINFDWTRIQKITPRFSLLPRLTAQYAFNSMVSGEQISIGGYNSVVGQNPSEYSGDNGFNLNLEGRYALLPQNDKYQLSTRIDYGWVSVKDRLINQDDSNSLTGVSLGLLLNPTKNISLRVDYGRPVGDRTDKNDYAYLQARYTY